MNLLSLLHVVSSWWFPVLAFLAPILLYGLYKLASGNSSDYVFSGGGGSYSITTTISPPSEWSTTEKMRATYYAEKMQECWMEGRC